MSLSRCAAFQAVPFVAVSTLLLACSGSTAPEEGPGSAGSARVREVSAGHAHTCALLEDGSAYCWGLNTDGRVGSGVQGVHSPPARVATDVRLRRLDAGNASTWAVTDAGGLLWWGGGVTEPEPFPTDLDPVALRADWARCVLDSAGRGWCWDGQGLPGWWFGADPEVRAAEPTLAFGGRSLTQIEPGLDGACAVDADGAVWCAGHNDTGQRGDGTFQVVDTATRIDDDSRYRAVELGFGFACGLTVEGVVKCWGANDMGQLANGELGSPVPAPAAVVGDWRFKEISVGGDRACAITTDDQLRCWGAGGVRAPGQEPGEPNLFGIGRPHRGVSAGSYHSCAISLDDGGIYCWGSNRNDQLGRDGPGSADLVRVRLPDDAP